MAINVSAGPVKMYIMPPKQGVCQVCAGDHPPEMPHKPDSLYYQVAFYAQTGRYPTWDDAMAHCAAEVQAFWKQQLRALGAYPDKK